MFMVPFEKSGKIAGVTVVLESREFKQWDGGYAMATVKV
jgi:hypothetical protein